MRETIFHPDGTVETIDDGIPEVPDPRATVLVAVATARAEVAGYSESNGTRQAVEALATAVETLIAPA